MPTLSAARSASTVVGTAPLNVAARPGAGAPARMPSSAVPVQTVSATDASGRTLAGTLMFSRTSTGQTQFWLRGRTQAHLLWSPDGKPVTNVLDAQISAKALIGKARGRTDLIEVKASEQQIEAPRPKTHRQPIESTPDMDRLQPGSVKRVVDVVGLASQGQAQLWTGQGADGRRYAYLVTRNASYPLGEVGLKDIEDAKRWVAQYGPRTTSRKAGDWFNSTAQDKAPLYNAACELLASPGLRGRAFAAGYIRVELPPTLGRGGKDVGQQMLNIASQLGYQTEVDASRVVLLPNNDAGGKALFAMYNAGGTQSVLSDGAAMGAGPDLVARDGKVVLTESVAQADGSTRRISTSLFKNKLSPSFTQGFQQASNDQMWGSALVIGEAVINILSMRALPKFVRGLTQGRLESFSQGLPSMRITTVGARWAAIRGPQAKGRGAAPSDAAAARVPDRASAPRRASKQPAEEAPVGAGAASSDKPSPGKPNAAPAARSMAQALGVPSKAVAETVAGLGGAVTNEQMIEALQRRHGLSSEKAAAVVRTVRRSQAAGARAVASLLKETEQRTDTSGRTQPTFTLKDWQRIAPFTANMPKVDNAIGRKLLHLLNDQRYFANGKSTIEPGALRQIEHYLRATGHDVAKIERAAGAPSLTPSNLTSPDVHFAQTLARSGLLASQPGTQAQAVGAVDFFGGAGLRPPPANAASQTSVLGMSSKHNNGPQAQHGRAVITVLAAGLGGRVQVLSAAGNTNRHYEEGVHRLVQAGVRVINVSLVQSEDASRTLAKLANKYKDVLFVVAAGNGINNDGVGRTTRDAGVDLSGAYRLNNVVYVGDVHANGRLKIHSNFGAAVTLYAQGDWRLADRADAYKTQEGTSFAAPLVVNTLAKVRTLDPALSNAQAMRIVMVTARKVRQTSKMVPQMAGKSIPVLDSKAAVSLAGLSGLVRRSGMTLDAAADRLKLNAQERAYLLPRARQLLNERSAQPARSEHKTPRQTGLVMRETALPKVNGHTLDDKTLRGLVGDLPGALVSARVLWQNVIEIRAVHATDSTRMLVMRINLDTKELTLERARGLWRDRAGASAQPSRDASRLLTRVLEQAQRLGLERATVVAPSAIVKKAHRFWVRQGFTHLDGDYFLKPKIPSQYEINGKKPNDVEAMVSTKQGMAWFDLHGGSAYRLGFDLKQGSSSWRRLRNQGTTP